MNEDEVLYAYTTLKRCIKIIDNSINKTRFLSISSKPFTRVPVSSGSHSSNSSIDRMIDKETTLLRLRIVFKKEIDIYKKIILKNGFNVHKTINELAVSKDILEKYSFYLNTILSKSSY